ncbi:hypothetical protein EDD21DRAFT_186376 [Dissophora ornata]|nr:hypothetical protein EDD21DRAFT_186376 [Dissophora ornata]
MRAAIELIVTILKMRPLPDDSEVFFREHMPSTVDGWASLHEEFTRTSATSGSTARFWDLDKFFAKLRVSDGPSTKVPPKSQLQPESAPLSSSKSQSSPKSQQQQQQQQQQHSSNSNNNSNSDSNNSNNSSLKANLVRRVSLNRSLSLRSSINSNNTNSNSKVHPEVHTLIFTRTQHQRNQPRGRTGRGQCRHRTLPRIFPQAAPTLLYRLPQLIVSLTELTLMKRTRQDIYRQTRHSRRTRCLHLNLKRAITHPLRTSTDMHSISNSNSISNTNSSSISNTNSNSIHTISTSTPFRHPNRNISSSISSSNSSITSHMHSRNRSRSRSLKHSHDPHRHLHRLAILQIILLPHIDQVQRIHLITDLHQPALGQRLLLRRVRSRRRPHDQLQHLPQVQHNLQSLHCHRGRSQNRRGQHRRLNRAMLGLPKIVMNILRTLLHQNQIPIHETTLLLLLRLRLRRDPDSRPECHRRQIVPVRY